MVGRRKTFYAAASGQKHEQQKYVEHVFVDNQGQSLCNVRVLSLAPHVTMSNVFAPHPCQRVALRKKIEKKKSNDCNVRFTPGFRAAKHTPKSLLVDNRPYASVLLLLILSKLLPQKS